LPYGFYLSFFLPLFSSPILSVLPSSLQRRRSSEAIQTLDDVWPFPCLIHCICIFGGCCRMTEFCSVQNSLYVQVLRSPVLAALLHGTPAAGVSQTLRRRTRNGIRELSQTAPPIFGREAITLGVGPHSSCLYNALGRPSNQFLQRAFPTPSHREI